MIPYYIKGRTSTLDVMSQIRTDHSMRIFIDATKIPKFPDIFRVKNIYLYCIFTTKETRRLSLYRTFYIFV